MSAEDSHSKPKLKISSENYLREEGSQDHLVADDGWFPASNRSGCAILISFKIVVVFNTTPADIKTKSANVVLKTTTILIEMRIAQLSS